MTGAPIVDAVVPGLLGLLSVVALFDIAARWALGLVASPGSSPDEL